MYFFFESYNDNFFVELKLHNRVLVMVWDLSLKRDTGTLLLDFVAWFANVTIF